MKRILYFECYSGISGDMTVAALLDLGADKDRLTEALDSLKPLTDGFDIEVKRVQKSGIDACDFDVILDKEHDNHDHDMEYLHGLQNNSHDHEHSNEHEHEHHHEYEHHHEHEHSHEHHHEHDHNYEHSHDYNNDAHHHTGMREITEILNKASISDNARKTAFDIFNVLAAAEAKAHNKPIDEVHFHEVGAVDSIVDIVSVAVCLDLLREKYNIDEVAFSELYEGYGTVRCQHGILPIPVPAVSNIVTAHGLPLHFTEVQGEFVTPTGAAIAAAIRTADKAPKSFKVRGIGIGAGKRNYERPSLLRAMILEEEQTQEDTIYKLESNIDDCAGEALGYVMDCLFEAGARDVHYTPVFMKKNRPAYQLNVICTKADIPKLEEIIFRETTTIGIRCIELERTVLRREKKTIDTSIGEVEIKICGGRAYPEYDSLVKLCKEKKMPYLEAYNIVMGEANKWECKI